MNERPRAHRFLCALAVCVVLISASPADGQPSARRTATPDPKTAFTAAPYDSLMLSEFAETLELAVKDLEREAARLNSLLTTRVPALNRGLDAAGVPWTVGRTVR